MYSTTRTRKKYDHRLRDLVRSTGDIAHATQLGIPRSTAHGRLAQTDISFSNSLIESWWRALKHQWLFLNTLDTVSRLDKLVAFYADQHNTRLPHSAFRGQTPNEMYYGTGERIPKELESAKLAARNARMEVNRAMTCPTCVPLT